MSFAPGGGHGGSGANQAKGVGRVRRRQGDGGRSGQAVAAATAEAADGAAVAGGRRHTGAQAGGGDRRSREGPPEQGSAHRPAELPRIGGGHLRRLTVPPPRAHAVRIGTEQIVDIIREGRFGANERSGCGGRPDRAFDMWRSAHQPRRPPGSIRFGILWGPLQVLKTGELWGTVGVLGYYTRQGGHGVWNRSPAS
jgi:hypothetical protein